MAANDQSLIPLSQLTLGQKALLVAFSLNDQEGERIIKMGLTPGENLEIVRQSASESTLEIKIRGYFVSLPKDQADRILVKLSV